jgi:hypothetical protein
MLWTAPPPARECQGRGSVLEGGTLEESDGRLVSFEPGMAIIYSRGVPHAGVKVVGDKPIKMLNVFIVDKGKPMTEFV